MLLIVKKKKEIVSSEEPDEVEVPAKESALA